MSPRTTDTSTVEVAIANALTHLRAIETRLAEAQRVHDEATSAHAAFGFETAGTAARVRLAILRADEVVEETTARLGECVHIAEVARDQWSRLICAAWRTREEAEFHQGLAEAQAVHARLDQARADRDSVLALLGLAQAGPHPVAAAAQLVAALEHSLRELSPPPPRPGMVCVRARNAFHDLDAGLEILRRPDDVFDVKAAALRAILAQELAVEVEA